jgi:hypothetical protein
MLYISSIAEVVGKEDEKFLPLSKQSFDYVLLQLNAPPAFVSALCQNFQPCGTGFRAPGVDEDFSWSYWTLIPIRVPTNCHKKDEECGMGMFQMNPHNYIHLKKDKRDIRGAHIAIHIQRDQSTNSITVMVIFFFESNRFDNLIKMPIERLDDAVLVHGSRAHTANGFSVLLIYLDVIMEWWNDVLYYFNNELIFEVLVQNSHHLLKILTTTF